MKQKGKDSDLQKIKEFIALMKAHNLVEIEITHGDDKILLKRTVAQTDAISRSKVEEHPVESDDSDKDLKDIESPARGIFYAAMGPDDDPFVEIGSEVTPQTKVCMIEAMKVMNQINAGITGQIVEILAKNGQAIEYGQPLFKVRPEQA